MAAPAPAPLHVDGAQGEGGGQVLRTALACAALTGRAVTVSRIRAGRSSPGLQRQHLAGVEALAAVVGATLVGAQLKSTELTFTPRGPAPPALTGTAWHFDIGSAGSTGLVLQALLPVLLRLAAAATVTVTVVGGTHAPHAPPTPFLTACLLPQLDAAVGAGRVQLTLGRHGFYPAGGGRVQLAVAPPARPPAPLRLAARGAPVSRAAEALVSNLPAHVGAREAAEFARVAGWPPAAVASRSVDAAGPGNAVVATLAYEHVTEVVSAFGERGRRGEDVAREAAEAARAYEAAPGSPPVGEHLADQLLLPLLVAAGGVFVTGPLSSHFVTNAGVLQQFFGAGAVTWRRLDDRGAGECWEVTVAHWDAVSTGGALSAACT